MGVGGTSDSSAGLTIGTGGTRTTPEICGFVSGTLDLSGYRIVLIPPRVPKCAQMPE
jgi:hypothetical protein